jgi:hypothetical protein
MEKMMLKMQQEHKEAWRYEWPLKEEARWPIQQLFSRRQQQVLRRWLRQVENLSDIEEQVCICKPEVGENLSDEEEKRSVRDLMSYQEGRSENSNFQVGNEERSIEDLINCQEGRGEIPDFQVGKGDEMRLSESLKSSEVSSVNKEC